MPNGEEVTGETQEEASAAMRDWYANHPGAPGRPDLNFPVEIEYEDGITVVINNQEEMRLAYGDCE